MVRMPRAPLTSGIDITTGAALRRKEQSRSFSPPRFFSSLFHNLEISQRICNLHYHLTPLGTFPVVGSAAMPPTWLGMLAAVLLLLPASATGQATLSNADIEVRWTNDCGIGYFGRPSGGGGGHHGGSAAADKATSSMVDPSVAGLQWSIQVVGSAINGAVTVASSAASCRGARRDGDKVVAEYEVAVPQSRAVLAVTVVTELLADGSNSGAGLVSSRLSVRLLRGKPGTIGLWFIGLGLAGVKTSPGARSFLPKGFGATDWAATYSELNYPDMSSDVGATMQFLSTEVPSAALSLYAGTHDGAAHAKALVSVSSAGGERDGAGPATADTLSLGYELTPEGAADPALLAGNSSYVVPFPLVVGVLPRDETEASWYTASQVYRSWVLPNAHWTKAGPVKDRTGPAVPDWLLHTDVWVNSGWSCLDKFNVSQGDPAAVFAAVSRVADRFALPALGFQWYEWQCGTKSKDDCADPSDPDRFRFDTHYPDYFPARRATLMQQVVRELRTKHNVRTFPYINGRLFDTAAASYTHPAGTGDAVSCAAPDNPGLGPFRLDQLSYYTETYGSGVNFHLADPSDPRWQAIYRDVVAGLVGSLGVDGVYIDQLAAAGPVLDFSPGRSHGAGGGAWWSAGIAELLATVRTKTPDAPVTVEGNAEDKLGVVQGMLVPSSFHVEFVRNGTDGDPRGTKRGVLAPAFAAVYGGYNVFFGDIYSAAELAHPDVLCAKLAVTFCAGTQVGWFSLGGVTHGPDLDKGCGEMGQLELWMDPKHDPEVAFLRKIASSRAQARDFVAFGRLGHPPTRVGAPVPIFAAPNGTGPALYPKLAAAVWIAPNQSSAVLLLVAPTHDDAAADYDLDPERWYLKCPAGLRGGYAVSALTPALRPKDGMRTDDDARLYNPSAIVHVRQTVAGRDVKILCVECRAG